MATDLLINIDHVATLRNARKETLPDPVHAAAAAEAAGADGIVVHLREDRRHITERDVRLLKEMLRTKFDFELSTDPDVVRICCEVQPDLATLVPERREEVTTEHGLDVIARKERLRDVVAQLRQAGIKEVALFVDPVCNEIDAAVETGADGIELHTGDFANAGNAGERKRCAEEAGPGCRTRPRRRPDRTRRPWARLLQLPRVSSRRPSCSGSFHWLCRDGQGHARRHGTGGSGNAGARKIVTHRPAHVHASKKSMDSPLLMPEDAPEGHRCGYVALAGPPNVGKSTLLNALIGQKLSIVTRKPQTTRHRIPAMLSADDHQIIFLDTPGIVVPRYGLHKAMMHAVRDAVADADLLVLIADASRGVPDRPGMDIVQGRPALLALNKMDLIRQEDALPLAEAWLALGDFDEVVPISARKGTNLDILLDAILKRLPIGPPLYPKDMISDRPERFFVAEIIREKVFRLYRQEIPYSTEVRIVHFEEREHEKDFVSAEIVLTADTQKGILIGKRGHALKRLGTAARKDIEVFLGRSVYLDLHVKVRSDWRNRPAFLRSFGYRA